MKTKGFLDVAVSLFASNAPVRAADHTASGGSLKERAAQGDAKAQFNLGIMYTRGQGVPQDYAEALK